MVLFKIGMSTAVTLKHITMLAMSAFHVKHSDYNKEQMLLDKKTVPDETWKNCSPDEKPLCVLGRIAQIIWLGEQFHQKSLVPSLNI